MATNYDALLEDLSHDCGPHDNAAAAAIRELRADRKRLLSACESAMSVGEVRFGTNGLAVSVRAKLATAINAAKKGK